MILIPGTAVSVVVNLCKSMGRSRLVCDNFVEEVVDGDTLLIVLCIKEDRCFLLKSLTEDELHVIERAFRSQLDGQAAHPSL